MINRFGVTKHSTNKCNNRENVNSFLLYENNSFNVTEYIQLGPTERTPLLQKSNANQTINAKALISSERCFSLKLFGVILLSVGGIIIGGYLLLREKEKYSIGLTLDFVNREAWSKMKELHLGNLLNSSNILNVFITHTGENVYDQSIEYLEILRLMEKNLKTNSQLPYNFLIVDDGEIYEIRGWEHECELHIIPNETSLIIGLLGNYTIKQPTEEQYKGLISLITESLRRKKLRNDYRLYGIRNISITPLDGEELYKVISKLDHFDSVLEVL